MNYLNGDQKTRDEIVQRLLDRQQITDVLMRYSRGVDRIDIETLSSCYWPDAIENHGVYNGPVSGFLEFIPKWEIEQDTTHVMGTIIVEFESPILAKAETYIRSFYHMPNGAHGMPRSEGGGVERQDLEVGGRYLDRFEKRGDEWRIAHRTLVVDWNRLMPAAEVWNSAMYEKVLRGCKYPNDALYTILLGDSAK